MIAPTSPPLIEFADDAEKLKYYREWKIVSPKAKELVPVLYCGIFTKTAVPCEVVGRTWEQTAVIAINDQLHCIDGTYLAALQPKFKMLPRKKEPYTVFLSDYVVFDLETTGFSRQNDSIIEIVAIRYEFNKKKEVFSTLVKNNTPINPGASYVNHITEEMLKDAPSIEIATSQFLKFIKKSPLVGHNIATFDLPFLQTAIGKELENLYCDTLQLVKKTYPNLPKYNLPYLAETLGLSCKPTHRAQQDVEATAELFWKCISHVSVPSDEDDQNDE